MIGVWLSSLSYSVLGVEHSPPHSVENEFAAIRSAVSSSFTTGGLSVRVLSASTVLVMVEDRPGAMDTTRARMPPRYSG